MVRDSADSPGRKWQDPVSAELVEGILMEKALRRFIETDYVSDLSTLPPGKADMITRYENLSYRKAFEAGRLSHRE